MTEAIKAAESAKVVASDVDVDDIVANPNKYGFTWDAWDVAAVKDKDGNLLASGKTFIFKTKFAVLPKVTDGAKFQRKFGWDALVDAYNGTSGRVDAQGVVRSMHVALFYVDKGKSLTEYQCRVQVVRRVLLGERAAGGGGGGTFYTDLAGNVHRTKEAAEAASKAHMERNRTWKGMDGLEYKTALEAKQASVAFMVAGGLTPEQAAKFVANMPE